MPTWSLFPIHRIVPLRDPVPTDEIELQATNGGLSARTTFAQMGAVPSVSVIVTALELIVADFNAKTLVPAQGANTVIIPQMIVLEGVFNTTPFDTVGAMNCGYGVDAPSTGDEFPNVFGPDEDSMLILQGAGNRFYIPRLQYTDALSFASQLVPSQTYADQSVVANKPLTLWWDGTSFTGGDTALKATCWFVTLRF